MGIGDVPIALKKTGLVEHLVVSGTRPRVDNDSDPRDEISIATIFYPVVFLLGMLSNLWVLMTICLTRRRNLTRTVILIANMSIADLLMLFTGGYLRYYDKIVFLASAAMCKVFNAADIMLLQVSSLTILTMAYERLIMVTDRGNLTRERDYKKQLILCGIIWAIGVSVSIPAAYYATLHSKIIACVSTYSRNYGKGYNLGLFLTTYCIPGLLIAAIYSLIVWKTKSILSLVSSNSEHQSRVFRMLAALVTVFWVFHFPFWHCMFRAFWGSGADVCSKASTLHSCRRVWTKQSQEKKQS